MSDPSPSLRIPKATHDAIFVKNASTFAVSKWVVETIGGEFPTLSFIGGSDDVLVTFRTDIALMLFKLRWL